MLHSVGMNTTANASQADSTALILGASGGLGQALRQGLIESAEFASVLAVSRTDRRGDELWYQADITDDAELAGLAERIGSRHGHINLMINCVGMLGDGDRVRPEKSLRDFNASKLLRLVHVNAYAPLAALRAFSPLLRKTDHARAAVLSAKVGSIGDNRLGGWHSYRMSKAALNMGLRNAAIELGRYRNGPTVVAIHPGTTLTELSAPYVGRHQYRSAKSSAEHILKVLADLSPEDSGKFFNWDGTELPW